MNQHIKKESMFRSTRMSNIWCFQITLMKHSILSQLFFYSFKGSYHKQKSKKPPNNWGLCTPDLAKDSTHFIGLLMGVCRSHIKGLAEHLGFIKNKLQNTNGKLYHSTTAATHHNKLTWEIGRETFTCFSLFAKTSPSIRIQLSNGAQKHKVKPCSSQMTPMLAGPGSL